MPMKFTDRALAALTTPAALRRQQGRKDRLIFDTETPSLGARVGASGRVTFLVQITDKLSGRKFREAIGAWGDLTVEQARDIAQVKRGQAASGVDLFADRAGRRERAAVDRAEATNTFGRMIDAWAAHHLVDRRPTYARESVLRLRRGLSGLIERPLAGITRREVREAIDRAKTERGPAAARLVHAAASACVRWALKTGRVEQNPFDGLLAPARSRPRERVLADAEIARIWQAARSLPAPLGPYVAILMLTLQRRSEVAGMRWSEISDDLAVWRIPGWRMKTDRPHDVALSGPARRVLAAAPRATTGDHVFSLSGRRPLGGFSDVKKRLDQAIAADGGPPMATWTFHDLRRSGVSWLASQGVDAVVADLLLAHKPGRLSSVAQVYQRHEFAAERRTALEMWGRHVEGSLPDNVVVLGRAGAVR